MPTRLMFDQRGHARPTIIRCQECRVSVPCDKLHGEPEHMPVEKPAAHAEGR